MSILTRTPLSTTYTGFEYATISVPKGAEELYRDTYAAFGWQTTEPQLPGRHVRQLKLKRPRSLGRREGLVEQQHAAEDALERIQKLEASRTGMATFTGWFIGMIGVAMLAYCLLQDDPNTTAYIVGIGGLFEWAIAPLLARIVRGMKTRQARPKIEAQYEFLYAATEHADRLLG